MIEPLRRASTLSLLLMLGSAIGAGACSASDDAPPAMELAPDPRAPKQSGGRAPGRLDPVVTTMPFEPGGHDLPIAPVTVNTVDTIVDDMRLMNDLALAGVPSGSGWAAGPGFVIMGNAARGTGTPSWWTPADTSLKSATYWNVVLPWLVVFDGVGNAASNTRVEMRRMRVYAKSKATGTWNELGQPTTVGGELYPKHLQGEATSTPDFREAGGIASVKPPGGAMVFHGWGAKHAIDAPDMKCLFVTVQARLAVSDGETSDDRALAKYLIHVGADYYPTATTTLSAFAPASYNPGVGVSRSKLVTSEWRAFNFATVGVGVEDPGGASISEAELRAAPPPLE
jgi:hypothetical protein